MKKSAVPALVLAVLLISSSCLPSPESGTTTGNIATSTVTQSVFPYTATPDIRNTSTPTRIMTNSPTFTNEPTSTPEKAFITNSINDVPCWSIPPNRNAYYGKNNDYSFLIMGWIKKNEQARIIAQYKNKEWLLVEAPSSIPQNPTQTGLLPYQSTKKTPTSTPEWMGHTCWVEGRDVEIIGSTKTITILFCYEDEYIHRFVCREKSGD